MQNFLIALNICPFENKTIPSAKLYGKRVVVMDIEARQLLFKILFKNSAPLTALSRSAPLGNFSAFFNCFAGTLITAEYKILPKNVYFKSINGLSRVTGFLGGNGGILSPLFF